MVTPSMKRLAAFFSRKTESLPSEAESPAAGLPSTIMNGGITIIPPDGRTPRHVPTDDMMTTNICFGGPDMRTAYITLSDTGRLGVLQWPEPGLKLNYN